MGNWIVLPVVLPAMMAPILVLAARHDIVLARVFSVFGTAALVPLAIALWVAAGAGPEVYLLGDWPAPFGIVLVLDRLAALMLVLTSLLAVAVAVYAIGGFDTRGRHFHALFQFQLMGVNGAFLTGDVFNLFVFFEVLLIASYGLMLHGTSGRGLTAGFQYIAINLVGSTLFLFAVGLIYGVTGTLNMADLIVKVPLVPEANQALLRVGALLLMVVFAIKAALVPLHFWLPGTYAAAGAPVAALFAIMTKVGAYALLRVHGMAFGVDAGASSDLIGPWLVPAALVTAVLGTLGVLGARRLRDQACFALIGSMGSLLVAIGLGSPASMAAALYYLVSSTLAAATLFLAVDLAAERRGEVADRAEPAPALPGQDLVAGLFFLAAILMVGMPPLSGFLGKLLVLDAARSDPRMAWIWLVILASSLITMVGLARTGSVVFWKSAAVPTPEGRLAGPPLRAAAVSAVAGLLLLAALQTVLAGPAMRAFEAIAADLHDPSRYVAAVLGPRQEAAR